MSKMMYKLQYLIEILGLIFFYHGYGTDGSRLAKRVYILGGLGPPSPTQRGPGGAPEIIEF